MKNFIIIFIIFLCLKLNCSSNSIETLKLIKEWEIKDAEFVGYFDIDTNGNIYLPVNTNIRVYSMEGELLKEFGKMGEKDGEFKRLIASVVVDHLGNIYACDIDLGRIQKFDSDGNFIKKWGKKVEKEEIIQHIKSIKNLGNYDFFLISALQKDCLGNIYAIDVQRVLKYDSEGNILASWYVPELKTETILEIDYSGNFILLDDSEILVHDSKWEIIDTIELPNEIGKYEISPRSKPESTTNGEIYILVKGEYELKESILLLKISDKYNMKAYKIENLSKKIIQDYWFLIDNEGKNIFVLAVMPSANKEKWFFQIYEIPK